MPGSWLGRILAAIAPGLMAFALLVIGIVAFSLMTTGVDRGRAPAPMASFGAVVTVVSAATSKAAMSKAAVVLKLEREGTVVTADVELVSDPAMPGPTSVAATPRRFGLAGFREAQAPPPPSAPTGSPLRPPRAA